MKNNNIVSANVEKLDRNIDKLWSKKSSTFFLHEKKKLMLQHASYILLFGNSFTYDTKLTLHQMEIGDLLRKN